MRSLPAVGTFVVVLRPQMRRPDGAVAFVGWLVGEEPSPFGFTFALVEDQATGEVIGVHPSRVLRR